MITTLTGSNIFALNAELSRLVSDFVKNYGNLAVERFDGEETEFAKIRESLEGITFLSTNKLVILRTPSANKVFVEHAEALLGNVPDTTEAIIVEPKLDKRLAYYKFLKKNTDFKEYTDLDERALSRWVAEEVKKQGGTITQTDAQYLIDRVGAGQQLLANELDKLLAYDKAVTRKTIELLTEPAPQSTIFELLDAAFAGNADKALRIYREQRDLKVEPQQIIAMLAWQLHILAVIKTAGDRSLDDISRAAKLNPFVIRKSQSIATKMTIAKLKDLVQRALELDVRLKSETIDAGDAIQHFLLSISD